MNSATRSLAERRRVVDRVMCRERYLTINPRAYTNLEELIGAPQNPRRLTVGFSLQVG
jgi:hypothetical protein